MSAREHAVRIHEGADDRAASVAEFVHAGLVRGEPAVVIAGAECRRAVQEKLAELGVEAGAAVAEHRLVFLDARETLAAFMVGKLPDPDRFHAAFAATLDSCRRAHGARVVRVYGEMVDLLLKDGELEAALSVEDLGASLALRQPVKILCGYDGDSFDTAAHSGSFARICDAHDRVVLAGGSAAHDATEPVRLRRRSLVLEHELRRRARIEADLRQALSERSRAEEAPREREAELEDFFENAPIAVHWVDARGTIVRVNRAELELLGYSRDEYVGQNIARFHADADRFTDIRQRLSRGETLRNFEARLRCKDGSIRDVLINSNAHWRGGELVQTWCFTEDVTQRKRTESAIRESESRLRLVADSALVSLALCGADRRFKFVNRAYADRFGLTPEAIAGRPIEEILGAKAYAAISPYIERVLRGEAFDFELEVPYRIGGTQWMRCGYVPERDPNGACVGWVAAIVNLTERKALEATLKEADRRKDEFLAMLAHELRNPLAPIATATQLLRRRAQDQPDLLRPVEVLARQGEHLTRLVDDLLEVSRITRGKIRLEKQVVTTSFIVNRAAEISRPLIAARKQTLALALHDDLHVLADPTRMAQVLANLLNNAAKFSDEGASISVSAEHVGSDAVFKVRDRGRGIAEETMPRLFQPFSQGETSLDRSQGRLGIGLSLVKGLVELHGGTVSAASDGPGRGAEFTVRLPAVEAPAQVRAEVDAFESLRRVAKRRILIVDDNADAAETLPELLELAEHDAVVVHDGRSALERVRHLAPDVVLLDIGLPGMNGFEVARRLRSDHGDALQIVALTGYGQDEDRRRTREAGFDAHLVKPPSPEALARLLARRPPRA